MQCTQLGLAAVYGFSKNSNPIIKTKSGLLEIDKSYIGVGCAECLEVLDKDYTVVKKLSTPSWDLTLIGLPIDKISIDKNGSLYVQNQNKCVALNKKSMFQVVKANTCKQPKIIGHYNKQIKGMEIKPAEWLLEFEGHENVALIKAGACT